MSAELPPARPTPPLLILAAVLLLLGAFQSEYGITHSADKFDVRASDALSSSLLGAIRALFAVIIFAVDVYAIRDSPIELNLVYLPTSTILQRGGSEIYRYSGWHRLAPFTMQSWTLLGVYFASAAVATFVPSQLTIATPIEVALGVLWNVVFPVALLVSTITTWVLIPAALRKGAHSALPFSKPAPLLAHNANLAMVMFELVFSRQPVLLDLASASVLWGLYFVVFSWVWCARHRMFFYFFLDTTLPTKLVLSFHLGLASALAIFSAMGAFLSTLNQGQPLELRLLLATVVWLALTRVRVFRGQHVRPIGPPMV